MKKTPKKIHENIKIPVEVSARHVHLSKNDLFTLFGKDYELTKLKDLSQTGEFACHETLTLVGNRGELSDVRIVGPLRERTQIELSLTDVRLLQLEVPLRVSGNLEGDTGECTLVAPNGNELVVTDGVIIAVRHIHANPEEAAKLGIKEGDILKVRIGSDERKIVFEGVHVRVKPTFNLALHIDTDEANAAFVQRGASAELIKD